MKDLLRRISPMLDEKGKTKVLSYSPEPWVLKQCLETDLVYLENPPDYEAFIEDISWDISYEKEAARRREVEPLLYAASGLVKKIRSKYLKRNKIRSLVVSYINRMHHGQTNGSINLLDIGCGWGYLLTDVLNNLGSEAKEQCVPFGIELSKKLALKSSENFDRLPGGKCINATALEGVTLFDEKFFDIVVMSSFLEHEINPLPLLKNCYKKMKSGGVIIIKVPNYNSVNRRVRGAKWCGFRWPDHVNYFTPKTLKEMAIKAGFKVDRMNMLDVLPVSDSMYLVITKPSR